MQAVVVNDFKIGPKFEPNYPSPVAAEQQVVVNVQAAALSNRVRSGALGKHYSSNGQLPLIPGVDGVGTLANGQSIYFVTNGSFASQALVNKGYWVALPAGLDPVKIAGMMNPALSSWMALQYRVHIQPGQKVMILGATGNAGALAVQVAKRLGAGEVIAVARDQAKLAALTKLGADQLVNLTATIAQADLAQAGQDVDIVLDYLWGDVTAQSMYAIVPHRANDEQPLKWVQIGSSAGQDALIPAAAFRAVALEMLGSGQGSVGVQNILESFKAIVAAEQAVPFVFDAQAMPLSDFDQGWHDQSGKRVVFTLD